MVQITVNGIAGRERQKLSIDWSFLRQGHGSMQETDWIPKSSKKGGGHFREGTIQANVQIKETEDVSNSRCREDSRSFEHTWRKAQFHTSLTL